MICHTTPVNIPEKGEMVVCGYLVTKHFSVFLNSVDDVATLSYDLKNNSVSVSGVPEGSYKIVVGKD